MSRIISYEEKPQIAGDDYLVIDSTANGTKKIKAEMVSGYIVSNIEDKLDESNCIVKRAYVGDYSIGTLSVHADLNYITLDGTLDTQISFLLSKNRELPNASSGYTDNFFNLYNPRHTAQIVNGHTYRLNFELVSGTVTRNGVTYTSVDEWGTTNVVRVFLNKANITRADYTAGDYYYFRTPNVVNREIDANSVGSLMFYVYANCVFSNAKFVVNVEDLTAKENAEYNSPIPKYWNSEIDRAVSQIRSNIIGAPAVGSTTVCFITDCHWKMNEKHSPYIVKELISKCNINYFVNGGDILYRHTDTKQEAIDELTDCINAFRICGKPMITVYGNHDRNRNNNTSYPERLLSHSEHANIVFKSFLPDPHIVRVTSDFAGFYWEDEFYRYAGIYWFSSDSHAFPEAAEICNTTKPVIIFCHGIYFNIGETTAEDTMDNAWILTAFEPYKNNIKCFIQGHSHRDAIRHAWGTVPIIVIDCDLANTYSTIGTITEQAIAVITFEPSKISIVKVGRGEDFVVTADSPDWRQEYSGTTPDSDKPL